MKKKIAQWRKLERAALRASWGGHNGGCVGGQGLRERGVGKGRGVSEQGQAGGVSLGSDSRLTNPAGDDSDRGRFRHETVLRPDDFSTFCVIRVT